VIVLLTNDLFLGSRIASAAQAAGIELRCAASVDQALQTDAAEEVNGVLVDLELPGLDPRELMKRLPQRPGRRVIAYGPHVHAPRLAAAREAGCDEVLSRGGLDRDLLAVLRRLDGPR